MLVDVSTNESMMLYDAAHADGESILWVVFLTVGNLIGLVGNSLVIFASFKYGTFKMDGATIVFVRQLAISDIIFILMYPVPITTTHIAHTWVLGDVMCEVIGHGISIPAMASINVILAVSIHRFMRCKYPKSVRGLDQRKANIIALAIWIFSCCFIVYTFITHMVVVFNGKLGACSFEYNDGAENVVTISVLTLVPFISITTLNLCLWFYVTRYIFLIVVLLRKVINTS